MPANETVARRPLLDGPADYAVLAVVVIVGTVMTGVWVTGQLAGLLFKAAWPRVNIGRSLAIAAALPHHLADPKQAWPPAARPALPGPAGFAIAALLAVAGLVIFSAWVVRRAGAGRSRRGYASARQLAAALTGKAVLARGPVIRPGLAGTRYTVTDVGVRIGRAVRGGTPLAITAESSVLVFAAPRQGKTSQVVIPWLRTWPGPALVTSVRPDVVENTATLRAAGRPVLVMAPTGMIDWPDRLAWSPTSGCEDFERARVRADVMVSVGKHGRDTAESGNAAYFGMMATSMLAVWLHAAAISGRSMDDVLAWALDERLDEPVKILRDNPAAAPGTAAMLDAAYRSPDVTRSNLWTTAQTAVAPMLSPPARATFTPVSGQSADIEAFLRSGGTIYLLVSEKQAADLAPLISAFFDEVTETAKRVADRSPGGRLDPPLGLFLDEAANVVPLPHLPALMSYAGGSGMFVVTVLQNRAQAEGRWGREGAAMLWGAATVKIALGGLSGDELRDLSALAGEYRESLTTFQRGTAGHTIQTTLQDRRTIRPEEIRTLSEARREALVIHATTPPVRVRMVRHYEGPDRDLYAAATAEAKQIIASAAAAREGTPAPGKEARP